MVPALFRFDDYACNGEAFHVVGKALSPHTPTPLHRHDYHELFLVTSGALAHGTVAGVERLEPGDLVMVRPDDAHALRAARGGCRIFNVTFHNDTAAHLRSRYAAELEGRFFWHGGAAPLRLRLAGGAREGALRQTEALRDGPRSLARIERYLLDLLTDLLSEADEVADLPPWLAAACRAAREPAVFRRGGAGLVAAAGRAHEHVCRQTQRHMGVTPTEYVNRIRMEYAAMLLGSSDASLPEIAERCGFQGLGHFHRLFRARYGTTPGGFRRRSGDPVPSDAVG